MPYLGNTPEQQAFTPAVDYFSGNGSTTAFTLSRPVASVAQVQAVIENVPQAPGTAYTVSGNTITFDGAPPSGTNNIYVYYTSPITQVIQPGQGTVGTAQIQSGVIVSFADGSAAAPSITNLDDSNTGMFFPAADTIAFAEGGTEVMRIDSSGNVGIGTSSPISGFRLDVQGGDFRVGDDANQGFEAGYSAGGSQAFVQGYNRGTSAFIDMQISAATLKFGTGSSATERMRITSGGDLQFNSGYGSVATAYGCRAWVNFNGSSGSIRSSGNVSSITRNSTGNYTVNFSTAMPDANYAVVASTGGANGGNVIQVPWASSTPSTTSYVLWSYTYAGGSVIDMPYVNAAVFR